jgi:hypothetical protein
MRTLPLLLLLLLLCLPLTAAAADPPAPTTAQEAVNRTLKAEYELARKPKIYFVLDLPGQQMLIKSSGVVLRQLPIADFSLWGRPSPLASRLLVEKESLFEPQRQTIDPEAKKEQEPGAKFELKTLELDDMPASFRLEFDDGTRITVKGEAPSLPGRLGQALANGVWHLGRPLIFNWKFLRGQPYTEILLTLPADEARRIYWSISEGVPCLIYWPQEEH